MNRIYVKYKRAEVVVVVTLRKTWHGDALWLPPLYILHHTPTLDYIFLYSQINRLDFPVFWTLVQFPCRMKQPSCCTRFILVSYMMLGHWWCCALLLRLYNWQWFCDAFLLCCDCDLCCGWSSTSDAMLWLILWDAILLWCFKTETMLWWFAIDDCICKMHLLYTTEIRR